KAEGLELQEEVELKSALSDAAPVEGLARTQYEGSGMFKLDAPALSADSPPPPAAEPSAPEIELLDEDMPTVDLPLIMPEDVPAHRRGADDDGAADAGALSQVEPVLTETMAELYLKQGHKTDALRVYQALLQQRPGDAQLAAKVAQLSGTPVVPPRRRSGA